LKILSGPAREQQTGPTVITEHGSIPLLPMGGGGYELEGKIATGGMAELFLGRRLGLGGVQHQVVIKRLRDEMLGDPTVVKMFEWEAWISSRLHHPNIVRFHDFVVHAGRHFLVLEYVPGCDLARLLRSFFRAGLRVPLGATLEIAIGAALALEHAHRLRDDDGRPVGLVHRDVSPHNIMLSPLGEVKIIDFGVAKTAFVPRDTGAGLIKGKMGYHAPEQLRGEPIDGRSDLYGLGVVLFELVSGQRLFSTADGLRALLRPRVPSVRDLNPDCPEALESLIFRALAVDPDCRFESARAMSEALREVRSGMRSENGRLELARLVVERESASDQVPRSSRDQAMAMTTPKKRQPSVAPESNQLATLPDGVFARARQDS
jgi:eukaryotic-like serine/threonine-protein kinase